MKEFVDKHRKLLTDLSFLIVLMLTAFIVYYPMAENNMIWGGGDSFQWLAFTKSGAASGYGTWLKYYAGGFPSSNYVLFYPVTMLLSWLPANYLAYVFYCLHISVGAFFFYLYLKELKCTQTAAAAMAVIYEFSVQISGLRRGHLVIICVIVYLPIVLYLVQKYFNTKRQSWLILSSAVLALAYYAGHIQNALYIDVVVFVYLVIYFIKEKSTIKNFLANMSSWGITYILLICPPLIQRLVAMREYLADGSSSPSYEYFAGWSMHPMKILDFLFPNVFGYMQPQAFGHMNSSEVDFEIFLGFGLAMIIIYTAVRFIKDFDVRLSLAMICVALIYCCCAHIPYVGEFIYSLPIFGGFRCSTRALFIFCFFAMTIAGIGLSRIRLDEIGKIKAFLGKVLAAVIAAVTIIGLVITALSVVSPDSIPEQEIASYLKNTYLESIVVTVLLIAIIVIIGRIAKKSKKPDKITRIALSCSIVAITLFEVYPYSFYKFESSIEKSDEYNEAMTVLSENIGNYKAWDALPAVNVNYMSILIDYRIAEYGIQAINSYTSLNNPALCRYFSQNSDTVSYNSSGILIGTPKAQSVLRHQNNFLSMMGIKYIVDNHHLIDEKGSIDQFTNSDRTTVVQADSITAPASPGTVTVAGIPAEIEENSTYNISFQTEGMTDNIQLNVDFCGVNYDFAAQESIVILNNPNDTYSIDIASGNSNLAEGQISLRFISYSGEEINIKNCTVTKYNSEYSENVYVPFFSNSEYLIYENVNANDILNIPQSVEKVDSEGYVFSNMLTLDLANVSYAVTADSMTPAPAEISNIDFGEDRITAEIKADGDTFVNFAECYFTGWKAFVDGKEVPVHKVNGIIMGANVPGGTHTIEFRFTAPYVWVTYGIAAATLLFWAAYFVIKHRKAVIAKDK